MSTFGSFTTVRLGLYSAQKGLDVTGNNITNINTPGYTRQRLNQVSLVPSVTDRYASSYNTRIGQGAVVTGVSQLRDPGLDISYRKAQSDVGACGISSARQRPTVPTRMTASSAPLPMLWPRFSTLTPTSSRNCKPPTRINWTNR